MDDGFSNNNLDSCTNKKMRFSASIDISHTLVVATHDRVQSTLSKDAVFGS